MPQPEPTEFTLHFRIIDEPLMRNVYGRLCDYADATAMDLTDPADIATELIYNLDVISEMRSQEEGRIVYTGWNDLGLER